LTRLTGSEIQGSAIGVIGPGEVGKEFAKKDLTLGMIVYGFDIVKYEEFLNEYKEIIFKDNIDEVFEKADVISLHLPHISKTDKLINSEVLFSKLRRKPIIINTSRVKLIDVDALILALTQGKIKGG